MAASDAYDTDDRVFDLDVPVRRDNNSIHLRGFVTDRASDEPTTDISHFSLYLWPSVPVSENVWTGVNGEHGQGA